jgi:spore cortex formation protein SpoVR/YcgB (stage V sporulation)
MAELNIIPEHFRSQKKFDAYIAGLRNELVSLLTSNIYTRKKNLKHPRNTHVTIRNELKEYNNFRQRPDMRITTVSWCSDAFEYLLDSIQSHKCLFILDSNKRLFVLKTIWELWVFDVYGRKFGRLSNDIYIFNQWICALPREVMI